MTIYDSKEAAQAACDSLQKVSGNWLPILFEDGENLNYSFQVEELEGGKAKVRVLLQGEFQFYF